MAGEWYLGDPEFEIFDPPTGVSPAVAGVVGRLASAHHLAALVEEAPTAELIAANPRVDVANNYLVEEAS